MIPPDVVKQIKRHNHISLCFRTRKNKRTVIVQRCFVAKWNLQFCSAKWGHISFFLVQYKKALRGNAVKTDAVFKRVPAHAKLSSLWMTVYQGEESWVLGYGHCFIRLVLITHAFILSVIMSLLPKGQVETWRFLRFCALIERQVEFLWHQQKPTNQQQCEAFKRAVALTKQLNRWLRSTWIHSAYIKKTSQPQSPLDVDLPLSWVGNTTRCGQSIIYVGSPSYGLEQEIEL